MTTVSADEALVIIREKRWEADPEPYCGNRYGRLSSFLWECGFLAAFSPPV
jgi:hypothetical protein